LLKHFNHVSELETLKIERTYLVVVLVAAGLAVTGFLLSGAPDFVFVAAVVVDEVALATAPGRREARLVFVGAALAGSLAMAGLASAFAVAGFAAVGFDSAFAVTGFAAAGLVLAATGLGLAAGAAAAGLGVVGVLGIDLGRGLLPAATLEVEAFAVDIAAGFLISIFVFAAGVPLVFALLSAAFGVDTVGWEVLKTGDGSAGGGRSCASDTVASSVGIAGRSVASSVGIAG
jgi:hypothetical protein